MNPDTIAVMAQDRAFAIRTDTNHQVSDQQSEPLGGRFKRAIDVSVALVALLLLSPIMLMVAGLLKLNNGGNIVFSHQRIGYRGRAFKCLKFQTMVPNGDQVLAEHLARNPAARLEWETDRKLHDDPRVTTIGRVLRSSSLDELPQLFNVLQGSMSIVGPRPIVNAEVERYGSHFGSYLACRPGITGLWQVSGRSNCGYERRVELDDDYAKAWSVTRDVAIMVKTAGVVIRREGSC